MNRFYSALLMLAVGLCLGCGRSTTVTGPDGEKTTITQKGKGAEITVKGKNGEVFHATSDEKGVALPEDFPTDVPIYPKATILTAMTMEKAKNVNLKTGDSIQQAEKFYKEKLKENGWEIKTSMNTEKMTMLQGTKKGLAVNIVISGDSDGTTINLTVAEEK